MGTDISAESGSMLPGHAARCQDNAFDRTEKFTV